MSWQLMCFQIFHLDGLHLGLFFFFLLSSQILLQVLSKGQTAGKLNFLPTNIEISSSRVGNKKKVNLLKNIRKLGNANVVFIFLFLLRYIISFNPSVFYGPSPTSVVLL